MANEIGTLLLLGASGDLSGRLLLPAFGVLLEKQDPDRDVFLLGAGTEDYDEAAWHDRIRTSFASAKVPDEVTEKVLARTAYHRADVTSQDDLKMLLSKCEGAPALYFALPPPVTARACSELRGLDLPDGLVLALEKPFGTNQTTAAALNKLLTDLVPENQIHRIDHFLGRSETLNLLGLRFANRLFEPLWNAGNIERVDIVFDENLTLENRARYYDGAGALIDMIQSHLLQVLALLVMEPPASVTAEDLQSAKAAALRACRAWGGDPATAGRRARYTAGEMDGRQVPDYTAEPGVDPSRNTETLAELTVEIDNWRWSGVPFRLRSGKSLGKARKEAIITFRQVPHLPTGLLGTAEPTVLRLAMGAPDFLALELNINGPADPLELDRVTLRTDFAASSVPAYSEVLAGILDGDPLLSVRGDQAEQCWRIVDPVLAAWKDGQTPMDTYPAGSDGPSDWTSGNTDV